MTRENVHKLAVLQRAQITTPTTSAGALAALTEALGVSEIGLSVERVRLAGEGGDAIGEIYLSNGTVMEFPAIAALGNPAKLATAIASYVGIVRIFKAPEAMRVLALTCNAAERLTVESDRERSVSWCAGYLMSASEIRIDMTVTAERWRAFSELAAVESRDGMGRVVIRNVDGTRLVRAGWFAIYVHRECDPTVGRALSRMVSLAGWNRAGGNARGRVKATSPGGDRHLGWNFYAVPPGWDDE